MRHHCDADCQPFLTSDNGGETGQECTVCGVWHLDPCDACGGRGYHGPRCPESDETAIEDDARALLASYAARRRRVMFETYCARRALHHTISASEAFHHARTFAPWPCPADYTDVVENGHEREVRAKACAIFRAEILPTITVEPVPAPASWQLRRA